MTTSPPTFGKARRLRPRSGRGRGCPRAARPRRWRRPGLPPDAGSRRTGGAAPSAAATAAGQAPADRPTRGEDEARGDSDDHGDDGSGGDRGQGAGGWASAAVRGQAAVVELVRRHDPSQGLKWRRRPKAPPRLSPQFGMPRFGSGGKARLDLQPAQQIEGVVELLVVLRVRRDVGRATRILAPWSSPPLASGP